MSTDPGSAASSAAPTSAPAAPAATKKTTPPTTRPRTAKAPNVTVQDAITALEARIKLLKDEKKRLMRKVDDGRSALAKCKKRRRDDAANHRALLARKKGEISKLKGDVAKLQKERDNLAKALAEERGRRQEHIPRSVWTISLIAGFLTFVVLLLVSVGGMEPTTTGAAIGGLFIALVVFVGLVYTKAGRAVAEIAKRKADTPSSGAGDHS